jgi:hypothetical protein
VSNPYDHHPPLKRVVGNINTMKSTDFQNMTPYSLVDSQDFGGTCLHLQGRLFYPEDGCSSPSKMLKQYTRLHGSSPQITVVFIVTTARTSNLEQNIHSNNRS